jgi:CopG family transcriptional regulator/antitoxin EndoAI
MHKRVNITLPDETLRLIDRAAGKGDRSRLIDEAVRYFVRQKGRARVRALLAEGAKARADRDRMIADEWLPLEEEAWTRSGAR